MRALVVTPRLGAHDARDPVAPGHPGTGRPHRDRLLAAATGFTAEHGWGALTMGKLADLVGVSRQTVYNELGGKPQLAEAMVMRELELFLDLRRLGLPRQPRRPRPGAIEAAAFRVLDEARTDPLLHAILSSSQGADSELLPLLTTNSEALLGAAGQMIREHVADLRRTPGRGPARGAHRHGRAARAEPRDAAERRAGGDGRDDRLDRRTRPDFAEGARPRLRAMATTETRLLLLGAVAIFEPVNGYQIRRELLSWGVESWANIKPGSIYNGLATLAQRGDLVRHDLRDGTRQVAVYELSDQGRAEFRTPLRGRARRGPAVRLRSPSRPRSRCCP